MKNQRKTKLIVLLIIVLVYSVALNVMKWQALTTIETPCNCPLMRCTGLII